MANVANAVKRRLQEIRLLRYAEAQHTARRHLQAIGFNPDEQAKYEARISLIHERLAAFLQRIAK